MFTLLDSRFAGTQEGTLHFAHLAREDGGLLQVSHTMQEHHAQLSALVRGELDSRARRERFLEEFVRPNGLDVRSAPAFVTAVEGLRPAPAPPAPASPQVLAALSAVWKVTPWFALRPFFSPSYRRLIGQYASTIWHDSLRGADPPRTVADLAPERAGTPQA